MTTARKPRPGGVLGPASDARDHCEQLEVREMTAKYAERA
jgi:hypothetical protein